MSEIRQGLPEVGEGEMDRSPVLELQQLLGNEEFITGCARVQFFPKATEINILANNSLAYIPDEVKKDLDQKSKIQYAVEQIVIPSLEKDFAAKRQEIEGKIREMLKEVSSDLQSRQGDNNLQEAFAVWGISPNSKGDNNNGLGYHAGIVHYFEYRGDKLKSTRFTEPMSLEGFIERSKKLKSFMDNPDPKANSEIDSARMLEDSSGQKQLFIFTKSNEMVVCFQRNNEPMKIISAYPSDKKGLARAVNEYLSPKDTGDLSRKPRLNQLGEGVHEITQES